MSSSEITIERRYAALCNMLRAQHFAWRDAVQNRIPNVPIDEVVAAMWEKAGEETANAFSLAFDRSQPLAPQAAEAVALSCQCMGREATVEVDGDEAFVIQDDCPWFECHARHGTVDEDRMGCDAWFNGILERLNEHLETTLAFETLETLPEGAPRCRRRIYISERQPRFME